MKYGSSVNKNKYNTNNITIGKNFKSKDSKDNSKLKTSSIQTIDKDKNVSSFRPGVMTGIVTAARFKTSKNSRK
jgi:hypothetical protein